MPVVASGRQVLAIGASAVKVTLWFLAAMVAFFALLAAGGWTLIWLMSAGGKWGGQPLLVALLVLSVPPLTLAMLVPLGASQWVTGRVSPRPAESK